MMKMMTIMHYGRNDEKIEKKKNRKKNGSTI